MNVSGCSDDAALARDIQSLNARFLIAIASGLDACKQFLAELQPLLQHARQRLYSGSASHELAQTMAAAAGPLDAICTMLVNVETQRTSLLEEQTATFDDIFARAGLRRKRKRSTRSRKSKAGKNGKVRQSGKKSKRGRKSPVGNPKKRVQTETMNGKPGQSKKGDQSRKSRNVTAPPTDSMKFGPCRDFFLSHLGDPYPTTVQKHQILKLSSPDFTLRSLNLWFVNIRRRSKWMDIFKKHAGSKRDAMRDLVARVEAQVAGRPAPNPLPSGAAPPGCKVDSTIVEEVMAMRAVVDMVSREVYGEGWDQILQIRPWTDEEVRAHEERKKASRREARAAKADEGKRKRDREEHRLQQKREREQRKRIEQEAVEGIRAARELHLKLMAMNKRKRDDDDESDVESKRRKSRDTDLGNGESKKHKLKVPKYDDAGNALSKEQRKAIKRAMQAAQAQQNPLKRKSPELNDAPGASMHDDMAMDTSPSKRRRRDALTFDGFPSAAETEGAAGEAEGPGMADLTQLFSMEWASPPREAQPLPAVSDNRATTATATSTTVATPPQHGGYGGFALPSDSHPPVAAGQIESTEGEVPRRFSQQLAAFALESGMFDTQNFELFTGDTFPGMEVDVHSAAPMPSGPSEGMYGSTSMGGVPSFGSNAGQSSLHLNTSTPATGSMSVSPSQSHSQLHTPMQQLATPTQHHVPQFEFAQPGDHHHHHHSRAGHEPNGYMDSSQHSNADSSDMSWINAALEHLPSQHDVARAQQQQQQQQPPHFAGHAHGHSQEFSSGGFAPQFPAQNTSEYESRPSTAMSVPDWQQDRAQRVHSSQSSQQPQQQRPSFPQAPSPAMAPMAPVQPRPSFPQPQAKPQSQSSAPKQRAPGSLWQTPHSQPAPQRYTTPGPSTYQAPPPPPPASFAAPAPPHSFPAPATPQYAPQQPYGGGQSDRRGTSSSSPGDSGPYGQRYAPSPAYQEQQPQPQHTQPSPSPSVDPKDALKEREAEFARAQEALQAQFRREQEEQLARFMRAQEELRNQLLGSR